MSMLVQAPVLFVFLSCVESFTLIFHLYKLFYGSLSCILLALLILQSAELANVAYRFALLYQFLVFL